VRPRLSHSGDNAYRGHRAEACAGEPAAATPAAPPHSRAFGRRQVPSAASSPAPSDSLSAGSGAEAARRPPAGAETLPVALTSGPESTPRAPAESVEVRSFVERTPRAQALVEAQVIEGQTPEDVVDEAGGEPQLGIVVIPAGQSACSCTSARRSKYRDSVLQPEADSGWRRHP